MRGPGPQRSGSAPPRHLRRRQLRAGAELAALVLCGLAAAWVAEPRARAGSRQALVPALSSGNAQALTGTLAAGESQRFELLLAAGEVAELAVDQSGVDVEVHLRALPTRQVVFDNPFERTQPERIFLLASRPTRFRLQIKPYRDEHGTYHLTLRDGPRPVEAGDEAVARAFAALLAGRAPLPANAAERASRIEGLRSSLAVWDRRGEPLTGAEARLRLAELLAAGWEAGAGSRQDLEAAADLAGEAHRQLAAASQSSLEARALLTVAKASWRAGRLNAARAAYLEALEKATTARNHQARVTALYELGRVELELGLLDRAVERYEELRQLPLEDGGGLGAQLFAADGLAEAYAVAGNLDALEEQAADELALAGRLADRRLELKARRFLGLAARQGRRPDEARRQLKAALALGQEGTEEQAITHLALSLVERDLRDLPGAVARTRRAIATLAPLHGDGDPNLETARFNLGTFLVEGGRAGEGLATCGEALERFARQGRKPLQASARLCQAKALDALGRLPDAEREAEEALALIEEVRAELESPLGRERFLAAKREYVEFYVDLEMRLESLQGDGSHAAKALAAAERQQARSLLDGLEELRQGLRQQVDPALAARSEELRAQIREVEEERSGLLAQGSVPTAESRERKLSSLIEEYDRLEGEIRRRSPRYRALTTAPRVSIPELVSQLLDENSDLLVYFLGERASFLWQVSRGQLGWFGLPSRQVIEAQAAKLLRELEASDNPNRRSALERAQEELSRSLLGPLAGRALGSRWLVVADGALTRVPFAVLRDPAGLGTDSGSPDLLVLDRREVLALPSLSVGLHLAAGLRPPARSRPVFTLVGDPIFRRDDSRLKAAPPASVPALAAAQAGRGSAAQDADLPPLPWVREELAGIRSLPWAGERRELLAFEARRETVLGGGLVGSRYVHFATHGVVDGRYPRASRLELSRFDEQGRPIAGALLLLDIYGLEVDAELVVVSACKSAVGGERRGEALQSFANGFLYAGARGLVVSQWSVSDASTSELMKRFYSYLLVDGMAPPAALRAAQLALRADRRWRSPYHWAAFVFQGLSR